MYGILLKARNQCMTTDMYIVFQLQLRHNERDGVSNHQPHYCLLNRIYKARIKEKNKAQRHWPLCGEFPGDGEFPVTVNSPNKGSITRKCYHLMTSSCVSETWHTDIIQRGNDRIVLLQGNWSINKKNGINRALCHWYIGCITQTLVDWNIIS